MNPFQRAFLLVYALCLLGEVETKFGGARGGGFGGGRGMSAARSSVGRGSSIFGGKSGGFSPRSYGGSFSKGGATNFRTRPVGGRSYYVPTSGYYSRNTFRSSFMGGFTGMLVGRMMLHSTMMRIDNRDYYFGRQNYPSRYADQHQMCSVSVEKLDANQVPFDTRIDAQTSIDNDTALVGGNETLADLASDAENNNNKENSTDSFRFSELSLPDGRKPEEIVWSCPSGQGDRCCYMECCPLAQTEGDSDSMTGFALIVILALVFFLLYAKNRTQYQGPIRRT